MSFDSFSLAKCYFFLTSSFIFPVKYICPTEEFLTYVPSISFISHFLHLLLFRYTILIEVTVSIKSDIHALSPVNPD